MPRRVTILVNDDGSVVVESSVPVGDSPSPTAAPVPVPVPAQEPVQVLMDEFLKAIKRNRKGAFEALGFERCSNVPVEKIEETIIALRAVVKVEK